MSNPTELPDLDTVIAYLLGEGPLIGQNFGDKPLDGTPYWWRAYLRAAARRAQPEDEAPQADDEAEERRLEQEYFDRWPDDPAATLSPLCGAQHVENGKEVADTQAHAIFAPEFPAFNPDGLEGLLSPDDLWGYACLVGYRTAIFSYGYGKANEENSLRPRGWLAGTGSDCSEDMYFRLEDAQRECDQHNQYERSRPDFDEDNLREPEPVYSAAQQAAAPEQFCDANCVWTDHHKDCTISAPGTPEAPVDPLDTALPCDIKVGNGTIRKGCKLRTLVARMESMHRMAMAALPVVTPEQRAEFYSLFPRAAQLDGGQEGSAT